MSCLCLWWEVLFLQKCSNNTKFQCSNARLLSSDSSGLLNNFVSSLTRRVISLRLLLCLEFTTSASNLVFPTLTLVRAILLQAGKAVNNCSFFQNITQHLAFLSANFELRFSLFPLEKSGTFSWVTIRPDSSGLATFTFPYVLSKRVKLLTEKRTLKASFFFQKQRESESLPEVQFVIWQLSSR